MASLARLLADAGSGRRRVLLLEGEAGIGKSRLLAELRQLAREQGLGWLEGAGQSIEQQTAYRAWRDLLAAYFGLKAQLDAEKQQLLVRERVAGADPALTERIPLLNDILRLGLPETDLTREFDPKLRRESLTWLIIDLLRHATADRPQVLVLEDAHWLDSLSWELALAAGRALHDRPLLLVLALRPLEEATSGQSQIGPPAAYSSLAGLAGTETMRLAALSAEETVALVAARLDLPVEALPAGVADLLRQRAGGNPFFAEELAHALRDSGALVVEAGTCTLVADPEALRQQVPDTVEGAVLSRIDRLPPGEQLTLKVAAVIGRSFLYRTVRDVHPRQVVEDLLRTYLDDLARRELTALAALEPELSYLFKHIITRQVAYDTLLFAQRQALHRAVAGWHEQAYADNLAPYYPLLVHHWHGAEDMAQERRYAQLAGEQAAAQFANAEAEIYLSRALALTTKDDLAGRYTLLLAREKVRDLEGDREAQRQDLDALQALADALDDDGLRAEVALRRAKYAEVLGDFATCAQAAQEAIRLAQASQDTYLEAQGYHKWAIATWRQGDRQTARSRLQKALELRQNAQGEDSSPLDEPGTGPERWHSVEAACLTELGTTYFTEGDFANAAAFYTQALALFRAIGDRRSEGAALNNLGIVSGQQGDYAQAGGYFEAALSIFCQIGARLNETNALGNLGIVARGLGDHAQARIYFEQSLHTKRAIGDRLGECVALLNVGIASRHLGDYAGARTYLERSLAIRREIGERRGEGDFLAELTLIFHHLGNDREAQEYGQQALHIAQELGDRHIEGRALTLLGHLSLQQKRLPEAAGAYDQALALRQEIGQPHLAMESLAGLIRVSLARGDLTQAQDQAEEILAYLEANTLDGTDEPFRIYLTCYRALRANQDRRARDILTTAHSLLQDQAAKIGDEALQRSFLENVAAHRELVAAYRASQKVP
jgi:tetratricopeptide (TPR) repeat protein